MKFRYWFSVVAAAILSSINGSADPAISGFSPNYGSSALSDPFILITGSGFGSGTSGGTLKVYFNGVQDTSAFATLANGTQIQAHVPAGAPLGSGPIGVSVNNSPVVESADDFTVIGFGPYITGFSPAVGSGGTSVQISGTHFTVSGTLTVKFNGKNAASVVVNSDSLITATTPNNVTTGPISVGRSGMGTNTTVTNFFVPPVITSFSPASGRTGTNVVIKGTNFLGATSVRFGSLIASNFSIDSNFQITAPVPMNATNGKLRVNTPAGSFTTTSNFTILPTLFGFTPAFGPPLSSVTVTGANFTGTSSVKFGGISASFSGVTFSNLAATVPAAATNAPITVTTASGSHTSAQTFFVPPRVSSFTPTNGGGGTIVKITGTNFWPFVNGVTAVSFNGTPAASFVVSNNNTIGAVAPDGVITGPISVTTPGGTSNSVALFYGLPVITTFSPTSGAPGSTVQINGTNFLGATAVLFNGTNASSTVTNNNVIGAKVPTNVQSGPITVITPGGTNTSTGTFTVIFTSDLNVGVTDFPDPVFVGSNLVYTITVANAGGPDAALNVMLTNKLPASVALKSASSSQGTLDTNSNPVIGSLGTIAKNGIAIVTLTVVPQSTGWITNVATIGSDSIDPTPNDHTNTVSTLVWPLPILSINLTNTQIKVSWPAALSNFDLLFKTNLFPATSWTTDQTVRVLTETDISVTQSNSGAAKFFRLRQ